MLGYDARERSKLVRRKAPRLCQQHASEPELGHHILPFDVYVTRLASVAAEEKEAVRT